MHRISTSLALLFLCLTSISLSAQLADGSDVPDFVLTDINGETHHLHGLLAEGKTVVITISATWCGPCWNYHNTHAMRDFYDEHGPDGTDESMAFFIEGDINTGMDDLLGETSASQGNWIEGVPYPIIDLQTSEVMEAFNVNYFPTVYKVCSDYKIYEVGQVPAETLGNWIESCTFEASLAGTTGTNCYGNGEGTASLDVSGGYGMPNYNWSNGSIDPMLENVEAGNYRVTVSDDNGRDIIIEDILVDGPEDPIEVTSLEITDLSCYQDGSGNIAVEAEGGNGVSEYEWSTGETTATISDLEAGVYTVTITDINQCSVIESFEVFEPEALEAEYSGQTAHCGGSDGSITVTAFGGTAPYTVSCEAGVVQADGSVTDLPAGEFEVLVTDANGCEISFSEVIGDAPPPEVFLSQPDEITCLEMNQSITATVNYDGNDLSFTWSGPNGIIAGAIDPILEVNEPGIYTLVVEDLLYGCETEVFAEVTGDIDGPEVEIGADLVLDCEQTSVDITATISNAGENYSIEWTTTEGNIVTETNAETVEANEPGVYTVLVTNSENGCSSSDEVTVTDERSYPSSDFTFESDELSVEFNNQSSGEGVEYHWDFGDGNTSNEETPSHVYAFDGLYNVCLTVTNGCGEETTCFEVLVEASPSAVQVGYVVSHVSCNAASDASIQLTIAGGVAPYSFEWAGPNGFLSSDQDIESLAAGNYVVIVTDSEGNQKQVAITINEPEELVVDTELGSDLWGYAIDLEVQGGTPPYMYLWNNGASTEDLGNLPAGEYFCQVIDANGCLFETEPIVIGSDIGFPDLPEFERDEKHVSLAGNPSVQPLQITVTGGVKRNTEHTYQLVNVSGVVIESGKWYGNFHSADLRGYPTGIYMLAIYDTNGWISTEKLFIMD